MQKPHNIGAHLSDRRPIVNIPYPAQVPRRNSDNDRKHNACSDKESTAPKRQISTRNQRYAPPPTGTAPDSSGAEWATIVALRKLRYHAAGRPVVSRMSG